MTSITDSTNTDNSRISLTQVSPGISGKNHNHSFSDDAFSPSGRFTTNKENLTYKVLGAPFGNRVRRSTPDVQLVNPSNVETNVDTDPVLNQYKNFIKLDALIPSEPTCTCARAADGGPNPPPPSPYTSWESFLASEGERTSFPKNPRKELVAKLYQVVLSYTLAGGFPTLRSFSADLDAFKRELTVAEAPQEAKAKFIEYKAKVDNKYKNSIAGKDKLMSKVIKKMEAELKNIKHNAPNRWVNGNCWSFSANPDEWELTWRQLYLPKALQAISGAASSVAMDHTFLLQRSKVLQNGITALNDYAQRNGWNPIAILGKELEFPRLTPQRSGSILPANSSPSTQRASSEPAIRERTSSS